MITCNEENFRITQGLGFTVQGLKAQHRRKVQRIEPGDRILFYVMGIRCFTATATAQTPTRIKPPILKNRAEILAERQRLANRLLEPGDSLLIRVYAFVDERGVTSQPDVKTTSGNARADTAAMLLVRKMVWQPAQNARRGVMVTIPVVLVRKKT